MERICICLGSNINVCGINRSESHEHSYHGYCWNMKHCCGFLATLIRSCKSAGSILMFVGHVSWIQNGGWNSNANYIPFTTHNTHPCTVKPSLLSKTKFLIAVVDRSQLTNLFWHKFGISHRSCQNALPTVFPIAMYFCDQHYIFNCWYQTTTLQYRAKKKSDFLLKSLFHWLLPYNTNWQLTVCLRFDWFSNFLWQMIYFPPSWETAKTLKMILSGF